MGIHSNVSRPHIGFSHSAHYTIEPVVVKARSGVAGLPGSMRLRLCAQRARAHGSIPILPYPGTEAALFLPGKQGNRLDMKSLGKKVHRLDLL